MAEKPAVKSPAGGKPSSGGKAPAKGKSYHVYKLYDAKGGELKRLRKSCPKCGSGHFLGEHKNRLSCGSCHYTEFVKK